MENEVLTQKFSLKVTDFDRRGRVKSVNPYRMHVRNGEALFERPVNSGNLFYENNEPAGRVEFKRNSKGVIIGKEFKLGEAHKAYVAPLTGTEKLAAENEALSAQNAKLLAELEAIKSEQAKRESEAKMPKASAPIMQNDAAKGTPKAQASGGGKPNSNLGDIL